MRKANLFLCVVFFGLQTITLAATRYVNINNANPAPPYTDWLSAATNIQDAVDVASAGDQILVTNGIYKIGNRVSGDAATNRVVVTNAVTVNSVNGSAATLIDGGATMRCVYLGLGATLDGFTLTNGTAANGGGLFCASTNAFAFNCVLRSNTASFGGGVYSGTLSNCSLTGNSTPGLSKGGGGAYNSVLKNCTLIGNTCPGTGSGGGGAAGCILNNCTLTGNSTGGGSTGTTIGGGASGSTLSNCVINGNAARGAGASGGGVHSSTVINCGLSNNAADFHGGGGYNSSFANCTLYNNSAGWGGGVSGGSLMHSRLFNNSASYGGGMISATLTNCVLISNSAGYGGGAHGGTLYNCTLYKNGSVVATGGGAYYSSLFNSIVYYSRGSELASCTLNYCCAPGISGNGNITNAPLFANTNINDLHLQAGSPCINAATNGYVKTIYDLDGNLRIVDGTVDIGAYEYHYANPLLVSIQANYTNVVVTYPVTFLGVYNGGRSNTWDFGDGTGATNELSISHTWNALGDYEVTLTVYDDNYPSGVSGNFAVHVISPPDAFVDPNSTNPVPPFASWETAATNIQQAIDGVDPGYHIIVTNGVYQTGGRVVYGSLTNRVAAIKPVAIESANGPAVTMILGNPDVGDNAVRCIYLTNRSSLTGFALLNGATRAAGNTYKEQSGAGAFCDTNVFISNCIFGSNTAQIFGGGVYRGTLTGCVLTNNFVIQAGGAAHSSILNNCIMSSNGAVRVYDGNSGGAADSCTLSNCVLVGNVVKNAGYGNEARGGGANNSTLKFCTLTNNYVEGEGAGAYMCALENCVLFNNVAGGGCGGAQASSLSSCLVISNYGGGFGAGGAAGSSSSNCVFLGNSGYQGGGASGGTLRNCLIVSNSALGSVGGGAYGAGLSNCTVFGNSAAHRGGGVDSCTVWNSIVHENYAPDSGTNWHNTVSNAMNFSSTFPVPDAGIGNITNSPLFVNVLASNFRLQSNSPCINSGKNAAVPTGLPDLDSNPRIVGGTVDIGAYEFQNPATGISYVWLQQYNLPTDGSADSLDSDGDGLNNWQEWRADTNPTNAMSLLELLYPARAGTNVVVGWQSSDARSYTLERATNFPSPIFLTLATNISGKVNATFYTNQNVFGTGPFFYRVRVEE